MKFCDITIAYNDRSGGIRTYIDAKRRFLRDNTDHHHLLVVPGDRDRVRRGERNTTATISGPLLPGQDIYRFFLTPNKIRQILDQHEPDLVELGSYYAAPWAAFAYRRERRAQGKQCLLGAYFHTDVAEAYVSAPLRAAVHAWLDDVSETLASGAEKVADVAALGAEKHIAHVFKNCDLALAASDKQAARLMEYGVEHVDVVPMGVDLTLFNPNRRSRELRSQLGADGQTTVLIYAGRLSEEKRVFTLVDAFKRLPPDFKAQLWITGDGPLLRPLQEAADDDPNFRMLPYFDDRQRFAEALASADVYVSAGPFETFALSVIEAQAAGLPVVGVDSGALRERVRDGLGFLGPTDDADEMARNIVRAAEARAQIGRRARTHVTEQFCWKRGFEQLLALYEEARESAGGGA